MRCQQDRLLFGSEGSQALLADLAALDSLDSLLGLAGRSELRLDLATADGLGVRVEAEHDTQVLERVLLELELAHVLDLGAQLGLDFIRVDDTLQISIVHGRTRKTAVGNEKRGKLEIEI